jgi:cation-transporting ATPase E
VDERIAAGAFNRRPEGITPSVRRIVLKNCLTLFNLINLFLAALILAVGGNVFNVLFIGVVICNTGMGIFQELRAKKTLDRLTVLARSGAEVVRGGVLANIPQESIVLDDIMHLSAGDQILADGVVVSEKGLETDESLLTGESDRIRKAEGASVLSGSFVTAGQARVRVTAVGEGSYANSITADAKKRRKNRSRLLWMLNMIIRILAVIIIPLGALLFYYDWVGGRGIEDTVTAVLGTSAAVVGMIPGGLILLTGVTLTVGAMNLARKKALVQSLPAIETLARADVLCLDKTGTITDGSMALEKIEPAGDFTGERVEKAVSELMGALQDQNATARVLRRSLGESADWRPIAALPFNSDRKWSGATFEGRGSYLLGSPAIVLEGTGSPAYIQANRYAAQGLRVLCLAFTEAPITGTGLPEGLGCAALILIADTIREDAAETFRYFAEEGVALKVISGDNPRTAGAVAARAGLEGAERSIDMSTVGDADFAAIVEEYTVFGHVTPRQKQELVRAMRKNGRTVCMTGDGVNDILAMREADCSVAMAGGSPAARNASDFVLLSQSFSAMTGVLMEGRRVVNNIERVAALYLVNTIFSVILSLIYAFLPYPYPYITNQMTPVNFLTTNVPAFFLALQTSYGRPRGRFFSNIFEHAFPAGLTVVFNTLYLQLAGYCFGLGDAEVSTMVVLLCGVVGFFLLVRVAGPMDRFMRTLTATMAGIFVVLFAFAGTPLVLRPFALADIMNRNAFFYLPLFYFSYHIHGFLARACHQAIERLDAFNNRL